MPGPGWLWTLLTPAGWTNMRQARVLSAYGSKLVEEMIAQAVAEEEEKEREVRWWWWSMDGSWMDGWVGGCGIKQRSHKNSKNIGLTAVHV